jgi:protein-tyrosine phosphatase
MQSDLPAKGSGASWPHDELLHAWWVEPDCLLAGEYPGDTSPEKAAAKIRLLLDAGIGSIVDLTTKHDGLVPYRDILQAEAERAGRRMHYASYPIPDLGIVDDSGYDEILEYIRGEMNAGRKVYLHCWGGVGRTSTVIASRLCDDGLDYKSAMARIAKLREGTRKANRPALEHEVQRAFVRDRCARNG